jgi:hypothetical protein
MTDAEYSDRVKAAVERSSACQEPQSIVEALSSCGFDASAVGGEAAS